MEEARVHLGSRAYALVDGILWFSNFEFNGLFAMDLRTGSIRYVNRFRELPEDKTGAHSAVCLEGEELFFLPALDDSIRIYHLKTQREQIIRLPKMKSREGFCTGVCQKEGKLWLFPASSLDDVLCLDTRSKVLEKEEWLSRVLAEFAGGERLNLRTHLYQNVLLLCARGKREVCQINLTTGEVQHLNLRIPEGVLSRVAYDGSDYWILLEDSQDVYRWNLLEDSYEKYASENSAWADEHRTLPYSDIVFTASETILVNYYAAYVGKINRKKGIVEKAFDYPPGFRIRGDLPWGAVFSGAVIHENKLYLLPQRGSQVVCYDLEHHGVSGKELAILQREIPYLEKMTEAGFVSGCVTETEELYRLERYIETIGFRENKPNSCGKIGEAIYESLKKG